MRGLDTLLMSTGDIVGNKLRSMLTLVGIVAGVASIIAVMTAISVIQGTLEREMSVLGAQTFQVQKWPAGGFHSDADRRKAMRRPPLTLENAEAIRQHVGTVDLVGSEIWDFGFTAQYKGVSSNPNISICGGTPEYPPNNTHYVGLGRNISQVDVKTARKVVVIGDALEETRQVLRHDRGVKPGQEDNFEFFNSTSLITQFNKMSMGVKLAAFVIGIIALVVAGIGIMNIMLVAVTERTREIGIRKALGAKPVSILGQFLLEAVILCNIGGLIGVLVGFGLGNLVAVFTHFDVSVPMEWAVIGLLFCSAVGVAFGLLPAVRASRLHPIDALRYE